LGDRRQQILELARVHGRVMVDDLATALGVSTHTIRRDINHLCEEAKLRRIHGGAEFIEGLANISYKKRAILNYGEKSAIAQHVADLVPEGSTLFISIGTTPALVAKALAEKDGLTVITNNLHAALALSENTTTRIIIPGGELRLPDWDLLNPEAIEMFATYRADFGIYGVGGIDTDGSLLDFYHPEVQAREQIRRHSRRSILVADHSKFGRRAAAVGGHLNDADLLVIDSLPAEPFASLIDALPGELHIAGTEPEREVSLG